MSFQPNFSNFYPPNVLPRVELKYKAKDLLRGNWPVLIGVTLLFLLLTGFQVNYSYGVDDGTLLTTPEDATWRRSLRRTLALRSQRSAVPSPASVSGVLCSP